MRVCQVAPLYESVPPKRYGGTERIISYLTEGLVERGHEVVLCASGDSSTRASLCAPCPEPMRALGPASETRHLILMEQVFEMAPDFDIIHFHTGFIHFPLVKRVPVAHVTTVHGRLDMPELPTMFRYFPEVPLVSISESQREPLPWLNWQKTVYHGLPVNRYRLHEEAGSYLAFLGRICAEKRLDRAIRIAARTGRMLKVAAKVDPADENYFKTEIEHLLDSPHVEYLGEVDDREKEDFLGNAYALVFPIDWPEPFGLAMIESFACGTPVIAYRCGSVPEVVEDGISGYIVENEDEAVAAVEKAAKLSRKGCRLYFEERFSADRMVEDYLEMYEKLISRPVAGTDAYPAVSTGMA